jgi:hypothetical protein
MQRKREARRGQGFLGELVHSAERFLLALLDGILLVPRGFRIVLFRPVLPRGIFLCVTGR